MDDYFSQWVTFGEVSTYCTIVEYELRVNFLDFDREMRKEWWVTSRIWSKQYSWRVRFVRTGHWLHWRPQRVLKWLLAAVGSQYRDLSKDVMCKNSWMFSASQAAVFSMLMLSDQKRKNDNNPSLCLLWDTATGAGSKIWPVALYTLGNDYVTFLR